MSQDVQARIAQNLARVEERISAACRRANRPRSAVTLVAVSKTRSLDEISAAYACGVQHLGENRAEELQSKVPALAAQWTGEPPRWHMIGHVQSRKARQVVALCHMLHSLDSLSLAARLNCQAEQQAKVLPVLVECNVSGEASKFGFNAWDQDDWPTLAEELAQLTEYRHLAIRGLMTMAPVVKIQEDTRPVFIKLRELRNFVSSALPALDWRELSMGMSDDFEVAVEEGATLVRIGRAIFESW